MALPSESSSGKEGFLRDAERAAKAIVEVAKNDGFIHVFSHIDADGVAAAGIMGKALFRLDAKFRVRITQWVEDKIIGGLLSDKPDLTIFTDLGSGYVDVIKSKVADLRIVVLDHHQISNLTSDNIIEVNPHRQGIDGARDLSGAGVAYFTAKAIERANVDLSPVAVVGALGDLQDKYDNRSLSGLNKEIVDDAVASGLLKVEKDLIFFGRETRPIHRTLASTTSPFIPGISGEEDKSLAFLNALGIESKKDDKWQALRDLSKDEKKRLCSALAEHLLSRGLHCEVTNLIGSVYTLNQEEPWTPLRDAREFGVLLNAAGRTDKAGLGIAVCMGDRGTALEQANKVLDEYRQMINKYLVWATEDPKRIKEFDNIYVVYGEDFINDKIIGAVSSILSSSMPNCEKPLIASANSEERNLAKISARTTEELVRQGLNLGEIMQAASQKYSGAGGGHNIAAGAQVPVDKLEEFITTVDQLVGERLRGQRIASHDNSAIP